VSLQILDDFPDRSGACCGYDDLPLRADFTQEANLSTPTDSILHDGAVCWDVFGRTSLPLLDCLVVITVFEEL